MKELNTETKKTILKALQAGTLTKQDLKTLNINEVETMLNNKLALISVRMGDIQSFSFNGNQITEAEYNRLLKVHEALGLEQVSAVANWNIEVINTGVPLASNEDEIKL